MMVQWVLPSHTDGMFDGKWDSHLSNIFERRNKGPTYRNHEHVSVVVKLDTGLFLHALVTNSIRRAQGRLQHSLGGKACKIDWRFRHQLKFNYTTPAAAIHQPTQRKILIEELQSPNSESSFGGREKEKKKSLFQTLRAGGWTLLTRVIENAVNIVTFPSYQFDRNFSKRKFS